jgi:hypothetical protein
LELLPDQVRHERKKQMSKSTGQKPETKTCRVQVNNLPRQKKELKDQEAENVKGGGGLPGGVVANHIGEEIPQRNRN